MIFKRSKGFTLTEAATSIAIFTLILVSILGAFSMGISGASLAKHKAKALYIATETIELWRKLPFSTMGSDGPRQINMDTNQTNDTSPGFCGIRTVTVTSYAATEHYKKVAVDISWTERIAFKEKTMHETLATFISDDPQAN